MQSSSGCIILEISIVTQWLTLYPTVVLCFLQIWEDSIWLIDRRWQTLPKIAGSRTNKHLGNKLQRTNWRVSMPLSTSICISLFLMFICSSDKEKIIEHNRNNTLRLLGQHSLPCRGLYISISQAKLKCTDSLLWMMLLFLMLVIYIFLLKYQHKIENDKITVYFTFGHINVLLYNEIKFWILSKSKISNLLLCRYLCVMLISLSLSSYKLLSADHNWNTNKM